jgi:hypothetical protein
MRLHFLHYLTLLLVPFLKHYLLENPHRHHLPLHCLPGCLIHFHRLFLEPD